MTEHQTMNTIIHAAFRRDLTRFDDALAAFPGSQARADQLWAAWDNYAHQLHQHHDDEETIFWPAMRELGADESLVGDLDGEHQRMAAGLEAATTTMQTLQQSPTEDNARTARDAVAAFGAILTTTSPTRSATSSRSRSTTLKGSPQWKTTQAAVRKAHKGNTGTFIAWLSDGADADARAGLAKELPAPVLFVIRTFGGRDYQRRIASVWS